MKEEKFKCRLQLYKKYLALTLVEAEEIYIHNDPLMQ